MIIIKQIEDMIAEELDGAEEYVKSALKLKDEHPALAKVFYDISSDEMRHVNALHTEAYRIIQGYRKEHGEAPAAMQAVYDYLHEKHIDKAARIKAMQSQYKGVTD